MPDILSTLSKYRPEDFALPVSASPCSSDALMGYIRADYDGRRWWSSGFPIHKELETTARTEELDQVYFALTARFQNLEVLEQYCVMYAEDHRTGFDYTLYVTGKECDYYISVCTVPKDYNLRVYAIVKKVAEEWKSS